jgi:hypothetical protein
MTERIDLTLTEYRALRERVRRHALEDGDWEVVRALILEAIEEAEPGQEWVILGVPEEDGASDCTRGGTVGVEELEAKEWRTRVFDAEELSG